MTTDNAAAPPPRPAQAVGPITRTCASGNHSRCLGTVYDLNAKGLVKCECPTPDCGHGTDTAKARRSRT